MPAFGVYPIADALAEGDEISSTYEGRHLTLLESELIHKAGNVGGFVDKGNPVVFDITEGHGVGIAFTDAAAATDLVAIDTEGIWVVDVHAIDDGGNIAVGGGDVLYINNVTAVVSKIATGATQVPFGYALGIITTPGNIERIAVKLHWSPVDNWILDLEPFFFGDGRDASIQWNGTFLAVAIAAASKALGLDMAISAAALADGYGFFEVNANVAGAATGFVAADSTWVNLGATFVVLAGGGLITPHTDGIYQPTAAVITGATIALCGKFTDQMEDGDFGMYNLWNLNLTQELTALFEVNNPALLGYAATAATGPIGSIPFFHTGGGATKYIMLYSNPA